MIQETGHGRPPCCTRGTPRYFTKGCIPKANGFRIQNAISRSHMLFQEGGKIGGQAAATKTRRTTEPQPPGYTKTP
eukprot:4343259-Amphidinium_carterae.1